MSASAPHDARAVAGAVAASLARQRELGSRALHPTLAKRIEDVLVQMVERAVPGTAGASAEGTVPVSGVADAKQAISAARSQRPDAEGGAPAPSPQRPARPAVAPTEAAPERQRPVWAPEPRATAPSGVGSSSLAAVWADVDGCTRCGLHERRTTIVFGDGAPDARLMFIGEGPGGQEDREGVPFVGKAGELLNRMIGAMGIARQDVYIANVVKCRPPGNRDPRPDEVAACIGFLRRQVAAVKPEVIVTLGRVAPEALLGRPVSILRERGTWTRFDDVPMLMTLHPAYLLRQPAAKKQAWEDLQSVMATLGLEARR